ncbi:MAG: CRISPR-associated endoribonuclease Cas6 [Bacteroidales bacterium]|nr:CRISPR-associated endoribonuclease Cas6 [Bacteroidales bacterium]
MRFKISLSLIRSQNQKLPLSYQYELSSFIYKTIARGDKMYADWLHGNGFATNGKQFRLFSFSNFHIPQYLIDKKEERLIIQSNEISFDIAFLPERSTEEFVKGIFANQQFSIGDKISKVEFKVNSIELLPQPDFSKPLIGKTLSPICVTMKNETGKLDYFSPEHPDYSLLLKNNLLTKYEAFHGTPITTDVFLVWETNNKPHPKLIKIKSGTKEETRIRGYNCRFKLFATPELMKIAYNAGIGEKNSMGFGMIEGDWRKIGED